MKWDELAGGGERRSGRGARPALEIGLTVNPLDNSGVGAERERGKGSRFRTARPESMPQSTSVLQNESRLYWLLQMYFQFLGQPEREIW